MSAPSDRPYRVMTVCTGNICRSPMAEVVLRRRLDEAGLGPDEVVVESTGTTSEEEGNPVDRRARRVLEAAGYDVEPAASPEGHRARQVSSGDVDRSDLVLAMTTAHQRALLRLAPRAAEKVLMYRSFDPAAAGQEGRALDVADPWYGDLRDFEECLDQVEAAAGAVVDHVRRALQHPER